jgi:hypothetical protein
MKAKHALIVACLLIPVVGYWGYRQWAFSSREDYYNLCEFSRAYHHFIRSNNGDLPTSLDALLDGEFLQEVEPGVYSGPEPDAPEIISVFFGKRLDRIDALELFFGGNMSDFEVVDDRLVDRKSKEEVIFVRPRRKYLKGFGRMYTVRIYEACSE